MGTRNMENEQEKYWMLPSFFLGILELLKEIQRQYPDDAYENQEDLDTTIDFLLVEDAIQTLIRDCEDVEYDFGHFDEDDTFHLDDLKGYSLYRLSSQINAVEKLLGFMRANLHNELSKK